MIIDGLQEYTKLKVEEISLIEKIENIIHIYTPHKGIITLETGKNVPVGFMALGGITRVMKTSNDLIKEIYKLEEESKDFLLEKWNEDKGYKL